MFGLFKSDPVAKLQKTIQKKYAEATALQRNGKIAVNDVYVWKAIVLRYGKSEDQTEEFIGTVTLVR